MTLSWTLAIYVVLLLIWIWSIYDIFVSKKTRDRYVWVLLVTLFSLVGTLIYYFKGREN